MTAEERARQVGRHYGMLMDFKPGVSNPLVASLEREVLEYIRAAETEAHNAAVDMCINELFCVMNTESALAIHSAMLKLKR